MRTHELTIKGPKNTLSSLVKNHDLVPIFYKEIRSFAQYDMAILVVQFSV